MGAEPRRQRSVSNAGLDGLYQAVLNDTGSYKIQDHHNMPSRLCLVIASRWTRRQGKVRSGLVGQYVSTWKAYTYRSRLICTERTRMQPPKGSQANEIDRSLTRHVQEMVSLRHVHVPLCKIAIETSMHAMLCLSLVLPRVMNPPCHISCAIDRPCRLVKKSESI